jgi:CubicO group peptidase (beta-lactamase class C family)
LISNDILMGLEKKIKKDKISSCLIQHHGSIVFQYYKNNKMKGKQHKVNSVTKSILSILTGIAIEKGFLEGVHQQIGDFFPNLSEQQKDLTIEHLLTMSPGLNWPEFGSWGGRPMPMINSKDWVKFILERPIVEPPGKTMYYNSGCSHLLSAIIQDATGQSLTELADAYLFGSLGIKEYTWYSDAKGIVIGGFGLSLKAEDMLKIGRLMLQDGKWKGKEVVSTHWIKESSAPRFHTYHKIGSYGYHWWVLTDDNKEPAHPSAYFAMGYGGQYIFVVPEYQLVATFTSDLYTDTFKPLQYFKNTFGGRG